MSENIQKQNTDSDILSTPLTTTLTQTSSNSEGGKLASNPYNYTILDKEISDIKDNSLIKDDKEKIINWMIPDYSAGIDKGLEFVSDDYYLMYVNPYWKLQQVGSQGCHVFINGVERFDIGTNYGESGFTPIYIKPNDVIKITYDCTSVSEICYPLIGAMEEQ